MRRVSATRRWAASAFVAVAVMGAAACSGSSHPAANASSKTTTTTRATAAALGPTPTTRLMPTKPGGAPGPVVTVPTESGSRPISEVIDSGQQILIEPTSFLPRILIAEVGKPVTWTNLTNAPQQLAFLGSALQSPVIAPGGKWSYTPPTSLNLHPVDHALGVQGTVDFNPAP